MEEQAIQHKWYVVRVKGGQEKKISTYIEKEVNRLKWNEFVTQILVPTEKVFQIRKGKKISKDRIFFPGYVLIEANLIGEIVHTLRALPGVFGFLGEKKGGEPIPMRQSEINRILGKVDELALFSSDQSANISDIYNSGDPFDLSTLGTPPAYWCRMGDGDTFPTLQDVIGSADLTMQNMTVADIVNDVP